MRAAPPRCAAAPRCLTLVLLLAIALLLVLEARSAGSARADAPAHTVSAAAAAPPPRAPSPRQPVIYLEFGSRPLPAHLLVSLQQAVRHHDDVVLLANASAVALRPLPAALSAVRVVDVRDLDGDALLARYRRAYVSIPPGLEQPIYQWWDERFFVIAAFLRGAAIESFFYGDSDVALNGTLPRLGAAGGPLADCDATLIFAEDAAWGSHVWVVWAGASIMSRAVVEDWTRFAVATYEEERFADVLRERTAAHGNGLATCDMTLWYLWAVAASPPFRLAVRAPRGLELPAARTVRVCDARDIGFTEDVGEVDSNKYPLPRTKLAIHFQGVKKARMAGYDRFG